MAPLIPEDRVSEPGDTSLLDGQKIGQFAGLHPFLDGFVELVCHKGQGVPFVQTGVVTLVQQGQCQRRVRRRGQRRRLARQVPSVGHLGQPLWVHHLKEHAVINVHKVIHDVIRVVPCC